MPTIESLTEQLDEVAKLAERVIDERNEAIECLEIAMSMWITNTGNRVWGATEREQRDRCAKALGPKVMQRITKGFHYAGPLRKA